MDPNTQQQAAPVAAPAQQQATPAPAQQTPLGQGGAGQPQQAQQQAPASQQQPGGGQVSEQQIQAQMAQPWFDQGTGKWRNPSTGEVVEAPANQNQTQQGQQTSQGQQPQPGQQQQTFTGPQSGIDAYFAGKDGVLDIGRVSQIGEAFSKANYSAQMMQPPEAGKEPATPPTREERYKAEILDYREGLTKEKLGPIEEAWANLEKVLPRGSNEYAHAFNVFNQQWHKVNQAIEAHMQQRVLGFQDTLDRERRGVTELSEHLTKGEWTYRRNLEEAARDIGGVSVAEQLLYGHNDGQAFKPSPYGAPLVHLIADVVDAAVKSPDLFSKANPGDKYRIIQNIVGSSPERLRVMLRYAFNDFRAKNIRHQANAIREAGAAQALAQAHAQTSAPGAGSGAAPTAPSRIQKYYSGVDEV